MKTTDNHKESTHNSPSGAEGNAEEAIHTSVKKEHRTNTEDLNRNNDTMGTEPDMWVEEHDDKGRDLERDLSKPYDHDDRKDKRSREQ